MSAPTKPTGRSRSKQHTYASDVKNRIDKIGNKPSNPFSEAIGTISRPFLAKVDDTLQEERQTIRIAFLSLAMYEGRQFKTRSIPISGSSRRGIDTDLNKYKLLSCDITTVQSRWVSYEAALEEAMVEVGGYSPDILCVNELAIPAGSNGPSTEFFRVAKKLASDKQALIVTGSMHDSRTRANTGYIFTPKKVYTFHKQVGAVINGERICISPRRQSLIVKAFGLHIAVIICLDLLDYSTVAALVDLGDVDLILVPAYCREEGEALFVKAARTTSKVLPGAVAYVNYHYGTSARNTMYSFGEKVKPIIDNTAVADSAGFVSTYELNLSEFDSGRRRLRGQSDDLTWLYKGSRAIIGADKE